MIVLPKLTTRASWPIGIGIVVLILLTGAVVFTTQPTHRTAVIVGSVLILALLVGLILKSVHLDPSAGRLVTTRLLVLRQTLDLTSVTTVAVIDNKAGEAMLSLKGPGPRTFVSLLHLTATVKRSLGAPRLTALADALDRFVPAGATGRGETTARLRAQAAHVTAGGAPSDSPLAEIAR